MRIGRYLVISVALGAASPPAKPPIQAADVFRLERAADVQISPDGRRLAYVRLTPDVTTDANVRSVWIVDLAGGTQQRLVAREASHPRWSPDASRIAFVGQDAGGSQRLFVAAADGSAAPLALTAGDGTPDAIAWSPDGSRIAFTRSATFAAAATIPIAMPPKPTGAHWAPDPLVVTSPHYSRDGDGVTEGTRQALYVVPARGGPVAALPVDRLDVQGDPSWDADGQGLVFAAQPRSDATGLLDPALYAVRLGGGAARRLSTEPDAAERPAVSPDGRTIAYLRHVTDRYIWQPQLWLMDRDGGHPRRQVPMLDRDVQGVHWTGDGRIAFSYGDAGLSTIAVARPDAAATPVATHGDGGDFSLARDGTVGLLLGSPDRPSEAGVADAAGERSAAPLNRTLLAGRTVGHVVPFDALSSLDGRRVPGWAMLPPGYRAGRSYPTILAIHGGPYGDEGPLWRFDLQLFAAAGYVVLYPNPRGSTSYGKAWTDLLPSATPQGGYADLMDVVDRAVATRLADPRHLYVTGVSYGGIMTAWIVGRTDRFRAAVAEKPAVNLGLSNLQDDQYESVTLDPLGLPWVAPERWWRESPISKVGNVRTPTMLIAGTDDRRTPPTEAQMFYNALQIRKIPSALILYPGASHESLGAPRSQLVSKTEYMLAWFARYR